MGAVTSASARPERTSSSPRSMAATAACPAAALRRPGSTPPASPAGSTLGAGSRSWAAVVSIRAGSPQTTTTARAATSGRASALIVTSGPMPAGSPEDTTSRGRLSGIAPQHLERHLDRVLAAERARLERDDQALVRSPQAAADRHPGIGLSHELQGRHPKRAKDARGGLAAGEQETVVAFEARRHVAASEADDGLAPPRRKACLPGRGRRSDHGRRQLATGARYWGSRVIAKGARELGRQSGRAGRHDAPRARGHLGRDGEKIPAVDGVPNADAVETR